MKIGVIADTHIPEVVKVLPAQIKEVFCNVDLILHAGDVYVVSVLDQLEHIAPIMVAEGDDDYAEVCHDRRVKLKHILMVGNTTIWLTHVRLWSWPDQEKRPDIIIFGHTHTAAIERRDGILLVNPGSPTFPDYKRQPGTVALLEVSSNRADASIIQLR